MNGQYRAHFPTREYGLQRRVAAAPHRQNLYLVSGGRSSAPQRISWAGVVLDALALLFIVGAIVGAMYVLAAGMTP